ncbi:universal stress protein [Aeromicrobium sp. CFBP 8757]|uniref:universal stress protein n=1 Tax=Aeromicrobium sp. CFBP 8757 TaxID=2775288 RepID=UPI00177DBCC7|nr:universal stress protein [Aeromicrobium sp. CFBP 8757]MBD8606411.1 universal stress protein [Aeromicrobium sp. CFBP 8757]
MPAPDRHVGPVVVGVVDDRPSVVLYGLDEAARLGAPVRLVHCYAALAGDLYFGPDPDETVRAAATEVLARAREVVDESGHELHVEYVLVRGEPGPCLVQEATTARVVVVGAADGVGWLEWMVGGDLSGHLALRAACLVVVVPSAERPEAPSGGVVLASDGDASTAGPLRYGLAQAGLRGESLHVLHAAGETTSQRSGAVPSDAPAAAVDVEPSHLRVDEVDACLEATENASLLVVRRPHGHGLAFALTRPVAVLVLPAARCPVAIVPDDYGSASAH